MILFWVKAPISILKTESSRHALHVGPTNDEIGGANGPFSPHHSTSKLPVRPINRPNKSQET